MNRYGYVALLLLASFSFGTIGFFTRTLKNTYGMSDVDIAFVRLTISIITLLVFVLIFRKEDLKIKMKDLWVFIIFGFFKLGSDIALFYAQSTGPLALATLLQETSPYFIVFFSLLFFKESITLKIILAVVFAIFGCTMATGVLSLNVEVQEIAIVAGLISGICYALYIVGTRTSTERGYNPVTTLFYIFLFAMIYSIPFAAPDMELIMNLVIQPEPLMYMLTLAIVLTLIPFLFVIMAIKKIGMTTTSIVCLSEIIFSALIGYLLFDEELNAINIIGIALVIISITVINIKFNRNQKMKRIDDKLEIVIVDGEMPSKLMNKLLFKKSKE